MQLTNVLRGLVFYVALLVIGFILGCTVGGVFFVPKDAGLAGGALVIGYGMIGAVAGLTLAYLLQRRLSEKAYVRAIWITAILALLGVVGLTYRFVTHRSAAEPYRPPVTEPTGEALSGAPAPTLVSASTDQPMGMGIASPALHPSETLYFYGQPAWDNVPDPRTATDSLVFRAGEHYTDIAMAPPWFVPEYSKLDYNLLLLRVMTVQQNWLEVIVNRQTGRTAWLDGHAVSWQTWPRFLLGISAVEPLRIADFPMRVKPLDHAGLYSNPPDAPWSVVAVQGDWLQIKDAGWIRWRDCGELLVQYVLLS